MKKTAAIIFALFYLMSIIGVAVNAHYCGGELKSVALVVNAQSCCDAETSCGCCQHETIVFQYDEKDVLVQSVVHDLRLAVMLSAAMKADHIAASESMQDAWFFIDWSPPPESRLWLKHHSLTYYG